MKLTATQLGRLRAGAGKKPYLWDNRQPQVLMNQITWALLIIFVLAFVLSNTSIRSDLEEAKKKLAHYRDELERVQATDLGKAVDKLDTTLEKLQLQELLNALDKHDKAEREEMYISSYLVNGVIVMENVLAGDKIKDQNFINGCNYAYGQFSSPDLELLWFEQVTSAAGIRVPSTGVKPVLTVEDHSTLTQENGTWLRKQIHTRIVAMRADMVNLENKIGALIQDYFYQLAMNDDFSFLENTEVGEILKRYSESADEATSEMVNLIRIGIRGHVRTIISNSQIKLLPEVMK